MAANEQQQQITSGETSERAADLTHLADEPQASDPEPGYFTPFKKRQQAQPSAEPQCNCGQRPGCDASSCSACKPAPSPAPSTEAPEPVSEQPSDWQPVRRLDGDGYAVRRDMPGGGCEHIGMPLLFNDARILAAYHNGQLHEVKPAPPVSEQEGERAQFVVESYGTTGGVLIRGTVGRSEFVACNLPTFVVGWDRLREANRIAAYLNGSSPEQAIAHEQNAIIAQQLVDCMELRQALDKSAATLREQAEEIERLQERLTNAERNVDSRDELIDEINAKFDAMNEALGGERTDADGIIAGIKKLRAELQQAHEHGERLKAKLLTFTDWVLSVCRTKERSHMAHLATLCRESYEAAGVVRVVELAGDSLCCTIPAQPEAKGASVACPQCGSTDTEQIGHGIWKCKANCMNPPASIPGEAAAEGSGGEPWYAHTISKGLNELRDKIASGESGTLPIGDLHTRTYGNVQWVPRTDAMVIERHWQAQLAAYKRDHEAWEKVEELIRDFKQRKRDRNVCDNVLSGTLVRSLLALASQLEKGGES